MKSVLCRRDEDLRMWCENAPSCMGLMRCEHAQMAMIGIWRIVAAPSKIGLLCRATASATLWGGACLLARMASYVEHHRSLIKEEVC